MENPSACIAFGQTRAEGVAQSGELLHRIETLRAPDEQDLFPETIGPGAREFAASGHGRWPALDGQRRDPQASANVSVTIVSHELRNSLGAIRAATHVLRTEPSAGAAAYARSVIERQVDRMASLVEDLVGTSTSQHGMMQLKFERGDLCSVAALAAQTVEFTMQQHNHRMVVSFPGAPLWVRVDAARLEQALVNLLLNAAKYTAPGGDIRLSVTREAAEAVVRVCDNGIGIDPDVLPYVFDLFVQANQSSPHTDAGMGIGLALVRSVVDGHGGCVTAVSAGRGCGSEFAIRLPIQK